MISLLVALIVAVLVYFLLGALGLPWLVAALVAILVFLAGIGSGYGL